MPCGFLVFNHSRRCIYRANSPRYDDSRHVSNFRFLEASGEVQPMTTALSLQAEDGVLLKKRAKRFERPAFSLGKRRSRDARQMMRPTGALGRH